MSDKKLLFSVTLDDCEIKATTGSGKGGQHRNTVNTRIQLYHRPSGVQTEAQDSKSQYGNKKAAFLKLANHPKFKNWCKVEASRIMGKKSVEELVDEQLMSHNLKIEVKNENNQWVEVNESELKKS